MRQAVRALLIAAVTTVLVTAVSYALPPAWGSTAVALSFLAATYVAVLGGDRDRSAHFGLSLGGILDRKPLSFSRGAHDSAKALAWALGAAAVIFPLFCLGYWYWWHPIRAFSLHLGPSPADWIVGEFLVIALPEEAFYRGFLQTSLDDAWGARRKFLGANIGWGIPATSALFAVGHFLTVPDPQRLAVFFPSLVFGWLRARTGGIGASLVFHALCNILTAVLARSFGLIP